MPDSMHSNDNAYPVPRPEAQAKAPIGLVVAVFGALEKAGFPDVGTPEDFARLQDAMTEFLYGEPSSTTSRTVTRTRDGGISVVMRSGTIGPGAEVTGLRIDGPLGGF